MYVEPFEATLSPVKINMQLKTHLNNFLLPRPIQFDNLNTYSLVLANSDSLGLSQSLLRNIWHDCDATICADGGANRLFDIMIPEERHKYLPDFIIGDLDSVRDPVKDYYRYKSLYLQHTLMYNRSYL